MTLSDPERLSQLFADIASQAGVAVMEVYHSDFESRLKADKSPVSDADERAEEIIIEELERLLPGIPILAEEATARGDKVAAPAAGAEFLLVDPVDGTREFLKRSPDFTINIALIKGGAPVAGAIYAPARGDLYFGSRRAFRVDGFPPGARLNGSSEPQRISTRPYPPSGLTAAISASHLDPRARDFLDARQVVRSVPIGSSLKFCLIARGDADIYPRWGTTMEWDTGAGHAILNAAGGRVLSTEGEPFTYGKSGQSYRNGSFIAWGGAPV